MLKLFRIVGHIPRVDNANKIGIMAHMLLTCVLTYVLIGNCLAVYTPTQETAIRSAVLSTSYDKYARSTVQTVVSASLNLLAIDELEIKEQKLTSAGWLTIVLKSQTLTSVGWITLSWPDTRLVWVPASYGGIDYIFADPDVIWKPELIIDNAMDSIGVLASANLLLKVTYDGTVEWELTQLFNTHCTVDITYYPYDLQKCGIEMVSWGYTFDDIKLEHARTDINLEDFEDHGEWIVSRTEVTVSNLTETHGAKIKYFPLLDFWLYLERRTDFYNWNVMMPIILTSLLVPLVFIVPVESGEKLSFILTILLTLAVLLTITTESLPPTSITTSVLGIYLSLVLLLAAVAVLVSVIIILLHKRQDLVKKRSFTIKSVRIAAKLTCVKMPGPARGHDKCKMRQNNADQNLVGSVALEKYLDISWTEIAGVLDRFFFGLFLTLTIASNTSFVVALSVGATPSDLRYIH